MRDLPYSEETPYEIYPEWDELDTGLTGEVWEEEINRNSPDYIRWVQRSLNQIMGLRLAADGILSPQTRSAIRSFQKQHRLRPCGSVGSQTEHMLVTAGASLPLGLTPANGWEQEETQVRRTGIPPTTYRRRHRRRASDTNTRAREICTQLNQSPHIVSSCVAYANRLADRLASDILNGPVKPVVIYDFQKDRDPSKSISQVFPMPVKVTDSGDVASARIFTALVSAIPPEARLQYAVRVECGGEGEKFLGGRRCKPVGVTDRLKYYRAGDSVGNPTNLDPGWYLQRGVPYQESSYEFVLTRQGHKVRLGNGGGHDMVYTMYSAEGTEGRPPKKFSLRHKQVIVISGAEGEQITIYGNVQAYVTQRKESPPPSHPQDIQPEHRGQRGALYLTPVYGSYPQIKADRRIVIGIWRYDYRKPGHP